MERDSLQVIHILNSRTSNWSQAGLFLQDAKNILNSFTTWTSSHTRHTNQAAHLLVKSAITLAEDLYDLECIPECISNTVVTDCIFVD